VPDHNDATRAAEGAGSSVGWSAGNRCLTGGCQKDGMVFRRRPKAAPPPPWTGEDDLDLLAVLDPEEAAAERAKAAARKRTLRQQALEQIAGVMGLRQPTPASAAVDAERQRRLKARRATQKRRRAEERVWRSGL